MSLCWNISHKVPWSCWYCECYLNDSFEFLRTTQPRNTVFRFSIILKFLVWGIKKKDVEQQIAFERSHTIADVSYFTGWSQTCKWHGFSWYAQSESWLLTAFLQRPFHEKYKSLSLWSARERQLTKAAAYTLSVSIVLLQILQIAELRLSISYIHCLCIPV